MKTLQDRCDGPNQARHEGLRDEHHYCNHETYGCVLKDADGVTLASLWGIIDPTREYRTVIEADLASEALSEIKACEAKAVALAARQAKEDANAASYMAL